MKILRLILGILLTAPVFAQNTLVTNLTFTNSIKAGSTTPGLITGTAGALTFTAAGTNKDITFTPSGTGSIVFGSALKGIYGGTGQTSFAVGDILYANTTTTLAKLTSGTSGFFLQAQGAGVAPAWAAASGAGLGDFSGPASSTDNAIVRFDGTGGKNGQNSAVTIADTTGAMVWGALQDASFTAGSSGASLVLGQGVLANATIAATGVGVVRIATVNTQTTVGVNLRLDNGNATVGAAEVLGRLDFYSNDSSGGGTGVRAYVAAVENDAGTGRAYDLTFGTGNVATATEVGRFTKTGNLLVGGTTDPGGAGVIKAFGQLIGKGTATNDAAASLYIGELLSAQLAAASTTSLVTTTGKTIISLSLTAGDWEVSGTVHFIPANTTAVASLIASVSTADNTQASVDAVGGFASIGAVYTSGGATMSATPIPVRVSLASTTTYYLVATGTFSVSTCTAYGTLRARRLR